MHGQLGWCDQVCFYVPRDCRIWRRVPSSRSIRFGRRFALRSLGCSCVLGRCLLTPQLLRGCLDRLLVCN